MPPFYNAMTITPGHFTAPMARTKTTFRPKKPQVDGHPPAATAPSWQETRALAEREAAESSDKSFSPRTSPRPGKKRARDSEEDNVASEDLAPSSKKARNEDSDGEDEEEDSDEEEEGEEDEDLIPCPSY